MRTKVIACSLSLAVSAGCGLEGENVTEFVGQATPLSASDPSMGQLQATLKAPSIPVDVEQVRFSVVEASQACDATPLQTQLAPLGALPIDGAEIGVAEHFFTLRGGQYRLCAQPLSTTGDDSRDCAAGDAAVDIIAGQTTNAIVEMACQSTTGGLSAVAAFNAPPAIEQIQIDPSRIISQCQEVQLTAIVSDIDAPSDEDTEISWQLASDGAELSNATGPTTSLRGEPGEHVVRVTATDLAGASSVVEIPLLITDEACFGAVPINFDPEPGAGTALVLRDDEVSQPIELGFEFEFFNETFDSVQVSSNGFLSFGGNEFNSGCCNGQVIPTADDLNHLIAFAWSDWNPSSGGTISTRTVGEAPNRRFLMEFVVVPEFGSSEGQITTQVKLFEGSNRIEVHTTEMVVDNHVVTQGVEDASGRIGFTLPGRNAEAFSLQADAVRFFTNAPNTAECGDGRTDFPEGCDDGNTESGDGCSDICQVEGVCRDVFDCFATCGDFQSEEDCSCTEGSCRTDGACIEASDCFPGVNCLGGQCTSELEGCTEDEQCAEVCDEETNRCVRCVGDNDCPFGVCSEQLGRCVECREDVDCTSDFAPFCGTEGFCSQCREDADCSADEFCNTQFGDGFCQFDNRCFADADCSGNAQGPVCDLLNNECVGCTEDAQCAGQGVERCDDGFRQCAQCDTVDDCAAGSIECILGQCVECNSDADCGPGDSCVFGGTPFGGTCQFTGQCRVDQDCQAGQLCSEFQCVVDTGCDIGVDRELFITDLSVVDDPVRSAGGGVWSFGGLMRAMAPSEEQAPQFVEAMFSTWLTDQTLNSFTVPARPAMGPQVLDAWPRTPDGELDLDQSPLTLNAIVNRIDLRNLDNGNAGEGRFVFGVNVPGGAFPQQFTVILEYLLPAETEEDVLQWATLWHDLGQLPFPSEGYNTALQVVTDRFSARGARPAGVNGNALSQVRTNEIALSGPWELREFVLSPTTLQLEPSPVELTPDLSFNNSALLAEFVNTNEAAIVLEQHIVPEVFQGSNFQAATAFNNLQTWNAPGIDNPEARHKFALNTCSGCHGPEAGIFNFLQVEPRFPGERARLSGFLTGTVVSDPVTRQPRQLNDLERRRQDLAFLACGFVAPPVDQDAGPPVVIPVPPQPPIELPPRPLEPRPVPLPGPAPFNEAPVDLDAGVSPAPQPIAAPRFAPTSVRRGIGRVH